MISLGGLCVLPWMSSASGKHNGTSVWYFSDAALNGSIEVTPLKLLNPVNKLCK
jgi:hypothetical protein